MFWGTFLLGILPQHYTASQPLWKPKMLHNKHEVSVGKQ